jgi:hypothetical protein
MFVNYNREYETTWSTLPNFSYFIFSQQREGIISENLSFTYALTVH